MTGGDSKRKVSFPWNQHNDPSQEFHPASSRPIFRLRMYYLNTRKLFSHSRGPRDSSRGRGKLNAPGSLRVAFSGKIFGQNKKGPLAFFYHLIMSLLNDRFKFSQT